VRRRARLSLIAVATLAVVVPAGARLGRAFEWARRWRWARCLLQRDDAGAGWLVPRHARRRDRVYAKTPTLLPTDETGASGVLASRAL
jgi:hypothetical protein